MSETNTEHRLYGGSPAVGLKESQSGSSRSPTTPRSRMHIKPLEVFNNKALEQRMRDTIKKSLNKLLNEPSDARLRAAILRIVQRVLGRHAESGMGTEYIELINYAHKSADAAKKLPLFEQRLQQYRSLRTHLRKYSEALRHDSNNNSNNSSTNDQDDYYSDDEEPPTQPASSSSVVNAQVDRGELCKALSSYLNQLSEHRTPLRTQLDPHHVERFYHVLSSLSKPPEPQPVPLAAPHPQPQHQPQHQPQPQPQPHQQPHYPPQPLQSLVQQFQHPVQPPTQHYPQAQPLQQPMQPTPISISHQQLHTQMQSQQFQIYRDQAFSPLQFYTHAATQPASMYDYAVLVPSYAPTVVPHIPDNTQYAPVRVPTPVATTVQPVISPPSPPTPITATVTNTIIRPTEEDKEIKKLPSLNVLFPFVNTAQSSASYPTPSRPTPNWPYM